MASKFRCVMEVLKFACPPSVLCAASHVCRLWSSVSASRELWREFLDSADPEECGASANLKLLYKSILRSRKDQLCVVGLGKTLRVYNCTRRQFAKSLELADYYLDVHCAVALLSYKELFVCGGERDACQALTLSLRDGSIIQQSRMCQGRASHTVQFVSGTLYVFGGFIGSSHKTAECYELLRVRWRNLPNMLTPRNGCTACSHRRFIYLCGGYTAKCEVFDTASEQYSPLQLKLDHSNWAVAFAYNGEVVVVARAIAYFLREKGWEKKAARVESTL